jgi:hypothetical protein
MIICIIIPCCFFLLVVILLVFSNIYKLSVISYTCSLLEITAWNLDNKLVTFLSIIMQNWLIHSMFLISCRENLKLGRLNIDCRNYVG